MMQPLKITAYLKSGFTAAFDWSVNIDGIIAYQSQLKKLGFEKFTENQSTGNLRPIDDLPIAKEEWQGDWWYQVSRPLFKCYHEHTKHIHRRFNQQEAEQYVGKIGKVELTKGAYRNARIARRIYVTDKVFWYVNGDKDAIQSLLEDVTHIGGNRGSGNGAVSRWEIAEHDNLDDCRFKRALPVNFHALDGVQLEWAIRPPYTLEENKRVVVMPKNAR